MSSLRAVPRVHPVVNELNSEFWHAGERGALRMAQCQECLLILHPPAAVCRRCRSMRIEHATLSGRGTVYSFTVNEHAWVEGFEDPFVPAIVELEEQAALRLTTNIVDTDPSAIAIGMPVRVLFEQYEDVWLPLFTPAR